MIVVAHNEAVSGRSLLHVNIPMLSNYVSCRPGTPWNSLLLALCGLISPVLKIKLNELLINMPLLQIVKL